VKSCRHRQAHEVWRFFILASSSSSVVVAFDLANACDAASDHFSAGFFLSAPTQVVSFVVGVVVVVGDFLLGRTALTDSADVDEADAEVEDSEDVVGSMA